MNWAKFVQKRSQGRKRNRLRKDSELLVEDDDWEVKSKRTKQEPELFSLSDKRKLDNSGLKRSKKTKVNRPV